MRRWGLFFTLVMLFASNAAFGQASNIDWGSRWMAASPRDRIATLEGRFFSLRNRFTAPQGPDGLSRAIAASYVSCFEKETISPERLDALMLARYTSRGARCYTPTEVAIGAIQSICEPYVVEGTRAFNFIAISPGRAPCPDQLAD